MVTSPEEDKSEVNLCTNTNSLLYSFNILVQYVFFDQVTMRTESEEREVEAGGAAALEAGGAVLPQAEEARKPDPCTEARIILTCLGASLS